MAALPLEGNGFTDVGREFLGSLVGETPFRDIDVGLGKRGRCEEGENGKVEFCHGFGVCVCVLCSFGWTLFF